MWGLIQNLVFPQQKQCQVTITVAAESQKVEKTTMVPLMKPYPKNKDSSGAHFETRKERKCPLKTFK